MPAKCRDYIKRTHVYTGSVGEFHKLLLGCTRTRVCLSMLIVLLTNDGPAYRTGLSGSSATEAVLRSTASARVAAVVAVEAGVHAAESCSVRRRTRVAGGRAGQHQRAAAVPGRRLGRETTTREDGRLSRTIVNGRQARHVKSETKHNQLSMAVLLNECSRGIIDS